MPDDWRKALEAIPYLKLLTKDERAKLDEYVKILVAEKFWEGCQGFDLAPPRRAVIAALAAVPILGLDIERYRRVLSILVYPAAFVVEENLERSGMVVKRRQARLGEAWYRGPVVLSWEELEADAAEMHRGHNVVWHEFAHVLDALDGELNGAPDLDDAPLARRWAEVMSAEHRQLRRAAAVGSPTLLDPYGATNSAEFFAVATEAFFTQGPLVKEHHPELYDLFCQYYRQNPAERLLRATG